MRINKYIALATGMSRRAADEVIAAGQVSVDGRIAGPGTQVADSAKVTLNRRPLMLPVIETILLNKPVGFVCSRDGQGSKTVYDLLPPELHHLKPVGRLDKDSSGLLLLTNDGDLANKLTHPSRQKTKVYLVRLNKALPQTDIDTISKTGVPLDDGTSRFAVQPAEDNQYQITMHEGRNRQIRRTFEVLGYRVVSLHRTAFDRHQLGDLAPGIYKYAK